MDRLLDGGLQVGSLTAIWDQIGYLGSALGETILDDVIAAGARILIIGRIRPR